MLALWVGGGRLACLGVPHGNLFDQGGAFEFQGDIGWWAVISFSVVVSGSEITVISGRLLAGSCLGRWVVYCSSG